MFLIAFIPRIVAVIIFPSLEGDAYSYCEITNRIRDAIKDGTLNAGHLFSQWLPLYQILCALIELIIPAPVLVPEIVSAIFGAATCVVVYYICLALNLNRFIALIAYIIITLNTYHILYSASAMTESPFGFFVAMSVYLAIKNKFILASIFLAFSCFTRYEGWMLIPVMFLLSLRKNIKNGIITGAILILPVLMCLVINYLATGNFLESFNSRKAYLKEYYEFHPHKAGYEKIVEHFGILIFTLNPPIVIIGIFLILIMIFLKKKIPAEKYDDFKRLYILALFFFAHLLFDVFSYLMRMQPCFYVRHGLGLLAIGLPLFLFTFSYFIAFLRSFAKLGWVVLTVITIAHLQVQVIHGIDCYDVVRPHEISAEYIKNEYKKNQEIVIFCDEPTVKVLSEIPSKNFRHSYYVSKNREDFLKYFTSEKVTLIVFNDVEYSKLPTVFPEMKKGVEFDKFKPLIRDKLKSAHKIGYPKIWLYLFEN